MTFSEFLRAEDGVATVDWVVLLGALTALGLWMMNYLGGEVLHDHSYAMRSELQDPHFDTDWFEYVAVLPPSME
jgi:Flp pilus assembly pilin Flp